MIAWRLAIRETPMARVMVTTTGRPSGIMATDMATAVMKSSSFSMPRAKPTPKSSTQSPSTMSPSRFANFSKRSWSGVLARDTLRTFSAIWPRRV